jgi:membrane associated rhomboid family serine protease
MIPLSDAPGQRRRFPFVNYLLIAINALVFLFELQQGNQINYFFFAYGVVPVALTHNIPQTVLFADQLPQPFPYQTPQPVWLTIFTSMFMHAGWLHIGGNMLFLYIFGDNVEDRFGHIGYLLFYLFCGVIATLAQTMIDPNSTIPSLGASGAIAGVLAAYAVFFPAARVRTLIFLGIFITLATVPALLLIGLWFVMQFFSGVASLSAQAAESTGGVAYFAHVGGFVAGLVIALVLRPWLKPPARVSMYPRWPDYSNARW